MGETASSFNSPSSSPLVARALELRSPRLKIVLENCRSFGQLRAIHAHMLRTHLFSDVFCCSRLLALCVHLLSGSRVGRVSPPHVGRRLVQYAERVFCQIEQPNLFVHNALIRVCSRDVPSRSFLLLRRLLRRAIRPDNLTFTFVLGACASLGRYSGGQAHAQIVRTGFATDPFLQSSLLRMYALCNDEGNPSAATRLFREIERPDEVTQTAMVHALSRGGDLASARNLFDTMSSRSAPTWSCMICGYVQNGRHEEALDLFVAMQRAKIKANEAAVVGVLTSCARLGRLDQGRLAHDYLLNHGISLNVILGTALADMYARCGDFHRAIAVFRELPARSRDWLAWTTMISSLAQHGRARAALELFAEMIESGVAPQETTFTAVLSACSHGGLVEEGLGMLHMMKEHGVEPGMEHYGCVVDLLGRAGRVEEAENMLQEMPIQADETVVSALLSACRVHECFATGQRVGKMLMQLRPDHRGYCLLAARVCAAGDRRRLTLKVCPQMENWHLQKKDPGKSVLIDGRVE